ncbi:MAG TPA: chemotaxis protein CheX [Verrucomicrobiae bacterium]
MAVDTKQYDELAKRYGFAPIPESVSRLTQLVAQQDADLDEIVKVIQGDPSLTQRLLRVANPHATNEEEYTVDTVEQAVMRNGIGGALILAMGTPLSLALQKAFQTMLGMKLEKFPAHQLVGVNGEHMRGSIGFAGKVVGHVYLRMSLQSSRTVAAQIFGCKPEEMNNTDEIRDAIGELLNIMTGNFKSNLCDSGLLCKLEPPKVGVTDDYSTPIEPGGGIERIAFRCGNIHPFVEVTANPWNG